jgi:hypothetical protein
MNSYVASGCTCFRMASCASGISASWPTGDVPISCLFAFSCSAWLQLRRPDKTRRAPTTRAIFGSAPSVLDRWWSSRGSLLPRCNFVLHLWSPPHETTLNVTNTLRLSARSVASRRTYSFFRLPQALSSQHFFALASFRALCVICCAPPHHLSTSLRHPSAPFNLHRARLRRNHGRLPSSRCIESAQTRHARVPTLLHRASDTTLGLMTRNNFRLA